MKAVTLEIEKATPQSGWDGAEMQRFDCADKAAGQSVHLYVPAAHPLAGAKVGQQIIVVAAD